MRRWTNRAAYVVIILGGTLWIVATWLPLRIARVLGITHRWSQQDDTTET